MKSKPLTVQTFNEIRNHKHPFIISHRVILHISLDDAFLKVMNPCSDTGLILSRGLIGTLLGSELVYSKETSWNSKELSVSVGSTKYELIPSIHEDKINEYKASFGS